MGVEISQLNEASSVQNNDVLPIVQNGETKKVPVETLGSQKVNKTGDTLTGELNFNNKNDYAAIRKTRTINGVDYNVNIGVGANQSGRMEFQDANNNVLGSVEAKSDGIYNGVSGKKLAEQSTGWSEATLSSGLEGKIRYTQIGNVVILNFIDFIIRKNIASHGEVLATGLPKSSIYLVSALSNYDNPSNPMRIGITNNGNIQTHYANIVQVGSGFYGTIAYITNE